VTEIQAAITDAAYGTPDLSIAVRLAHFAGPHNASLAYRRTESDSLRRARKAAFTENSDMRCYRFEHGFLRRLLSRAGRNAAGQVGP